MPDIPAGTLLDEFETLEEALSAHPEMLGEPVTNTAGIPPDRHIFPEPAKPLTNRDNAWWAENTT